MGIELEELLNVPVDLIPLNEAPPHLKYKILTEGKPLIIRDNELYTNLVKEALGELQDTEIKLRIYTKS